MEAIRETGGRWQNIVQNSMERNGNYWKLLVSYRSWARLAPTLTHITTRDPVISDAEDNAMSLMLGKDRFLKAVYHYSEVKQGGHNVGQNKRKGYTKEQ